MMEQRLANTWQMTVNEKRFIETALQANLRVDERGPFDYRELTINFGWNDGSAEVHLGQTRVVGLVTAQLVEPYWDRPNEGNLFIYTEFSPMADPSFEAGRPGEAAVELGRIIDRGLRESRAVDTESLCVLTGKLVWSLRVDLQILDNAGNLIDAANIAALAALLTFRRPECTLGGEDGHEVTVNPPEVSEPVPLIVHHLPIAVTFAFFSKIDVMVVDPNHFEEALMAGRMTFTLNISGEVCAIQKPGGVGIAQSTITQCLQIASSKAAEITRLIENAVELYKSQRGQNKHTHNSPDTCLEVSTPVSGEVQSEILSFCEDRESRFGLEKLSLQESCKSGRFAQVVGGDRTAKSSLTGPSSWNPYSKGADPDHLKVSLAAQVRAIPAMKPSIKAYEGYPIDRDSNELLGRNRPTPSPTTTKVSKVQPNAKTIISLKDAVKPKSRRKKISPPARTF